LQAIFRLIALATGTVVVATTTSTSGLSQSRDCKILHTASSAYIPPFELNVDDAKWKVSRNQTPPRPQSIAYQADIVRQLAKLEEQGIIEKPNEAYYSQILMVPKPDRSKRICIDFRNLNDCTEDASWPIPNITEMLRRIGTHKATVFAVLDLTQGYHQAPLTLAARVCTAFILFCGVCQFTRLPFGPKRAPFYFQQTMATVVLAGLIYAEQAFHLIKSETAKCTTMHLLSDTDPIYLHTDASDYGVGG
jgi:hypothetical protein